MIKKNNSFKVTTIHNVQNSLIKKIIYSGILIGIATLLTILEFPIFPESPFLEIDFSLTIIFLALITLNWKYALIISISKSLLHFLITGGGIGLVPGMVADMIASASVVIIYQLLCFCLNPMYPLFFIKIKMPNYLKLGMNNIKYLLIFILAIMLISIEMAYFNQLFLLKWYGFPINNNFIWITIFSFNIIKYSLNISIFILITQLLLNRNIINLHKN